MPILGSIIKTAYSIRHLPVEKKKVNPENQQRRELKKLITRAQNTAFGEHYGFSGILQNRDPVRAFREKVPIHDYTSMFRSWWYRCLNGETWVTWPGRVKYFALTSGTSEASSKQIPVTPDMLRAIRKSSIRLLVLATKYDFPDTFYEKGILMIGGSTHLQYNGTYYQGDLSGITASNIPFWFQHFYMPGPRISREREWSVKLNDIVEKAREWDIGVIVGVPAWIQIILERIIEHYSLQNIHEIWPNLSAYVHSGVAFAPYRKSIERLLGRPIIFNESYLASEGYIAFQKPWNVSSMTLVTDCGLFYEFIPYTPANFDPEGNLKPGAVTLTIGEVEEGKEYALVLSSCAGAWRYLIGDTLKFVSREKAEIILTGRTKHFLNICGEHLSVDNMNRAVQMLQEKLNVKISEFTVSGIRYGSMFAHQWYLGTNDPLDPELAAGKLDEYLKILNDDYRVERLAAIQKVQAEVLPLHLFYDWMKIKGKEGGAHKFPRVMKYDTLCHWEEFIGKTLRTGPTQSGETNKQAI